MALAPAAHSSSMYLNALDTHRHHIHHFHLPPLASALERRSQPQRRVTLLHNKTAGAGVSTTAVPSPSANHSGGCAPAAVVSERKKKSVRFHDELEQIRLFLKTQKPVAVRADPQMPALTIKLPNWPAKSVVRHRAKEMVRMESVQLVQEHADDSGIALTGRCRVANLAFHKRVVVRYTMDCWQSFHETEAMYREPIGASANTWDRFTFDIQLEQQSLPRTVYLVLRYTVNENEFWDNNDGLNYQVDIVEADDDDDDRDAATKAPAAASMANTDPTASTGSTAEGGPSYRGTVSRQKQQQQQQHPQKPASNTKKLGHRYDFGASLSAAKKLELAGSNSPSAGVRPTSSTSTPTHTAAAPFVMMTATLNTNDQAQQYHDLIRKYCFYGNPRAATSGTTPPPSSTAAEPICG